jgi:hypothetical protein
VWWRGVEGVGRGDGGGGGEKGWEWGKGEQGGGGGGGGRGLVKRMSCSFSPRAKPGTLLVINSIIHVMPMIPIILIP